MNAQRKQRILAGLERHPSAKTWKFKSPSGEIITITDLAQFCRSNNLNHECMRQVFYRGTQKSHKGYTAIEDTCEENLPKEKLKVNEVSE